MLMIIRALLLSLLVSYSINAEEVTAEVDSAAPTWSLKKGEQVYGSEQAQGKPYVLHFWATWCPYCKKLQPGLASVAENYIDDGISTYAVSFWEDDRAKPIKEMKRRGLDLNVLVKGDEVAKAFAVQGTPTTIFIDHNGDIAVKLHTSDPNDPQIRIAYELLKDGYQDKDKVLPAEQQNSDG